MKVLLTEDEGYARLMWAVEQAGGSKAYARKLRCSHPFISSMVNRRARITGVVADDLHMATVKRYELTLIVDGPEQERYVKQRHEWMEQNGLDPFDKRGVR